MNRLSLDFDMFAQEIENIENDEKVSEVENIFYLLTNGKMSEKDVGVKELVMMLDNLADISHCVNVKCEEKRRMMERLEEIIPCKTKTVWF